MLVSIALTAVQYAERATAQNVSRRRNGPRPDTRHTGPRPRHIAPRPRRDPRRISPRPRQDRDVKDFVRDETLVRLVTKTSRLRPHPCKYKQAGRQGEKHIAQEKKMNKLWDKK